jgi:HAE1 family hydrophobic/amphiphilic exporter-1
MNLVKLSIQQPITVAVGVVLSLLAGLIAFDRIPVQMTPQVDSIVIAVSTNWENASADEIESDVIDEQEQYLGDLSGLISMTSTSQAGSGQIRLEFATGTDIRRAMAEVDQKLSEVPGYPMGVDQPTVEDIDPESVDYIAWIGLACTDPNYDATKLYDFMDRRMRPLFERIPGVSQVGIRGAREAEVRIKVDPIALAQRGITYSDLVAAIDRTNVNFSGGNLPDGKRDVRIRAVGRFEDVETVEQMVIRRDESGPTYLRDVATVEFTYKERTEWVRARGHLMPYFNFQLRRGGNLLDVMGEIQAKCAEMNAPGGMLEQHAKQLGINGTFELVQSYDATDYVNDAIALVQSNLVVGGILATLTLLLFLRSLRTVGIIAIAIPISTIAAIVLLQATGRTLNIVSLAGLSFAVGMVVDNAIVVIENIYRHLGMGKSAVQAAHDGAAEVGEAVVASTLTTLIVFGPILLIEDQAGQLFRDIALAIMGAVGLSMIVALTVIPSAASVWLKPQDVATTDTTQNVSTKRGRFSWLTAGPRAFGRVLTSLPARLGSLIYLLTSGWIVRLTIIAAFTIGTIVGIWILIPPLDYLPSGNRNVAFGVLIPPSGYNVDQMWEMGERMEARIRPFWEAAGDRFKIEEIVRGGPNPGEDHRVAVPLGFGQEGEIVPPPLENYFLVAWNGTLFHGAISLEKEKIADVVPLLNYSVADGNAPDVLAFAFQAPLFRIGGTTGTAINIDLTGDDLDRVSQSALGLMLTLGKEFGFQAVRPEPANFNLEMPELRITPNQERLDDVAMKPDDLGRAVQASGDGILLPRRFEVEGELKDLRIVTEQALADNPVPALYQTPVATPSGQVVDLGSLAALDPVSVQARIKHVDRRRAVTLQFTPPGGIPLEAAIEKVDAAVAQLREQGQITPDVEVGMSGSAGKLNEIRNILLGDGTIFGTITSSLFLAFLVVYLLMVVLFQSWAYPMVIMVSVPLATFGGFLGLAILHESSLASRYLPVQNLDVLTILGFVILAGTVVNNAILIVHQALNFLQEENLSPREAISKSVETRVRPILMSTMTSVGGMLPLVFMPGSGSELYRGLGAVIVGGLVVSTVFTLILVPIVLSVVFDIFKPQPKTVEV